MRKCFFYIIVVLLTGSTTYSQVKQAERLHFTSHNSGGFVAGESNAKPLVQTVNGVSMNGWFIGAGVGLDYYNIRSIPVFGEVRKQIFNKPFSPYLYAAAGHHYIWQEETEFWKTDYKGGFYYDFGIGYRVPVFKNKHVFFSAGYTGKQYSNMVNSMPWISVWPPPDGSFIKEEHKETRIAVKVGLSL